MYSLSGRHKFRETESKAAGLPRAGNESVLGVGKSVRGLSSSLKLLFSQCCCGREIHFLTMARGEWSRVFEEGSGEV